MKRAIILVLLVAVCACGCASRGKRVSPETEPITTHDFNPKDLQIIGKQSVQKMLAKGVFTETGKPFVYVTKVRNLTDEHINTELITEYVATQVGDSGQVRLTGVPKELAEAVEQLEFQQGQYVDPATAQEMGKMIGAEYFLQGELANLTPQAGWKKGQYFLFTLTLVKIETMEAWKSQVEIQKVSRRGLFGW